MSDGQAHKSDGVVFYSIITYYIIYKIYLAGFIIKKNQKTKPQSNLNPSDSVWRSQHKGSAAPGQDPALQLLSHSGSGHVLCPPPFLSIVEKWAFTSSEKCYSEMCTEQS